MKTKSTIIFLFSIVWLSNLYAEDNYEMLQQKIDSLETRLDKIYTEQVDNNSDAPGDALNWGSGLFLGAKTGTHYTLNFEIGYMFRTSKKPWASLTRDYIGKRKDYRFGISTGVQMFNDETVFKDDLTFYKSSGYGVYGKIAFGSPVLLNFISFSWHLKAMYTIPAKNNDHNITDERMVYGYGNDIEFWLTENECVTLGYTDEKDSFFGENNDDPIYPSRIRFVFGFKTFF
ncbi:hypothetical protein HQ585_20670 [candidate division KSB1 bacterium]|nr:hypothetical protein [candidate division KSB1 bacterium]